MPLPLSPALDTICALARAKDLSSLYEFLIHEGLCIDATFGRYTAIELLAREGNRETVEFLMEQFGAHSKWAVQGFAAGGFPEEVDRLLEAEAHRNAVVRLVNDGHNHAIRGFAESGYEEDVNRFLNLEDAAEVKSLPAVLSPYCAIQGYARGGYVAQVVNLSFAVDRGGADQWAIEGFAEGGHNKEVNECIRRDYRTRHRAVYGYAAGGFTEEVNKLLMTGADRDEAIGGYATGGFTAEVNKLLAAGANHHIALEGYFAGGHIAQSNELIKRYQLQPFHYWHNNLKRYLNTKTILPLLVTIEDNQFRADLARTTQSSSPSISLEAEANRVMKIVSDANRIRECMNLHKLSFLQGASLCKVENRFWFIQGPQLLESVRLTKKERLPLSRITSFVTGLPMDKAQEMHDKSKNFFPALSTYHLGEKGRVEKSRVCELVKQEIGRLSSFSVLNVLIWIGLLKSPAVKIAVLKDLANIIMDNSEYQQKREAIMTWATTYKEVMTKQRNVLHTFFQPSHISKSQRGFEEICAVLNIKEDDLNQAAL